MSKDDRAEYDAAYADAELGIRLAEIVYAARIAAGLIDFLQRLKLAGFPCLAFARQAGARWVVRDTG